MSSAIVAAGIVAAGAIGGAAISASNQPDVPDPNSTSGAQAAANIATARNEATLNRYDQYTPNGNLTWSQSGPDKWTSTSTLDPASQGILNTNKQTLQKTADQVNSTLGQQIKPPAGANPDLQASRNYYQNALTDPSSLVQPSLNTASQSNSAFSNAIDKAAATNATDFNYNNLGPMPSASDATRQKVADALYNQSTSRLNPQWQQSQNALDSKLANQGITLGSDAWKTSQQNQSLAKNDAYNSAINSSITGATDAMNSQYNLAMQGRQQGVTEDNTLRNQPLNEATSLSGLANSATGQASTNLANQTNYNTNALNLGNTTNTADWADRSSNLNEQYAGRNQVLNELNAMNTGSQVQQPQFQTVNASTQVAPTNVSQNTWNAYQANQAQANGQNQAMNQGLSSLGQLGAYYTKTPNTSNQLINSNSSGYMLS